MHCVLYHQLLRLNSASANGKNRYTGWRANLEVGFSWYKLFSLGVSCTRGRLYIMVLQFIYGKSSTSLYLTSRASSDQSYYKRFVLNLNKILSETVLINQCSVSLPLSRHFLKRHKNWKVIWTKWPRIQDVWKTYGQKSFAFTNTCSAFQGQNMCYSDNTSAVLPTIDNCHWKRDAYI